ncbi:desulfoferrodoxin family protein [Victivallis sp. Marseille-Q1083]|uniref:desulfoferrodoxin family protein n=1 Tax=Victivallis sp. Marseille-Q1083 TaxID=2717288 RepID=UPI00158A1A4F|nr:desulfoferrodoxin family protein [Victivallis sp. Marseille-Q1083]
MNKMYQSADHGVLVEVVGHGPGGECLELKCGDQPMKEIVANTVDAAKEKHVPVVEGDEKGVKVKVGSVPHPMTPEHYIEWIEVINGPYVNRKYLKPGEQPEAEFYVPRHAHIVVRAFCNLHGLWQA